MDIPERTYTEPSTEQQHKAVYPDHWERYAFAVPYVKGKRILDVACGSGYGTALLARHGASHATGLDLEAEAVSWARKYYGDRADFHALQLGEQWPVESGMTDVVVSMETLEHVADPRFFLQQIARCLAPDGILVMSTPLNETESRLSPHNPFHLREYSWDEFGELISSEFEIQERWTQISQAAEKWSSLKKTRLGGLLSKVKRLLPTLAVNHLRNVYSKNQNSGAGRILQGKNDAGNVQLIVAAKINRHGEYA